jgi:hypothetical protein
VTHSNQSTRRQVSWRIAVNVFIPSSRSFFFLFSLVAAANRFAALSLIARRLILSYHIPISRSLHPLFVDLSELQFNRNRGLVNYPHSYHCASHCFVPFRWRLLGPVMWLMVAFSVADPSAPSIGQCGMVRYLFSF